MRINIVVMMGVSTLAGAALATGLAAAAGTTAVPAFVDSGANAPTFVTVTKKFDLVRKNTPTVQPVANGYAGGDCYKDHAHARILAHNGYTSDDNSVENCTAYCMDRGYKFAGVEYANECHCGDDLLNGAELLDDAGKCDMACKGDSSEQCGGSLAMLVYESG